MRVRYAEPSFPDNKNLTRSLGSWSRNNTGCRWTLTPGPGFFDAQSTDCTASVRELAGPELYEAAAISALQTVLGYSTHLKMSFIKTLRSSEHLRLLLQVYYHLSSERWLIVHLQHGLGNRLRAGGSAIALAKESGRMLRIIWPLDRHVSASFEDLFECPHPNIVQLDGAALCPNSSSRMRLVFELMPGGSLASRLASIARKQVAPLRSAENFAIAICLAKALLHAQSRHDPPRRQTGQRSAIFPPTNAA